MKIKIRFANKNDINKIFTLGKGTSEFAVSKYIKFYEKSEIKQWIKERRNNIIILAEQNSNIIGFMYCNIMSNHWAMIDNFYILSKFRNKGFKEHSNYIWVDKLT